ncbi:hypothetical protein ABZ235_34085 [Streptomyces canus]|uniref:hypothetical protein n=1 Tax=Streptomyces canus TaxID=58343 RepID=UPI00339FDEB2
MAAEEPPRYAADPDGVIREAVLCAEPHLDPVIVARVVGEVAPDRTRRRRLARSLQEAPDLLTSGRPEGPRLVGDLIDALLRAGADRVVPPRCGRCGRQKPLTYVEGTVRICGTCGHQRFARREECSVCGNMRAVARRDRHGRSQCAGCARGDDDPARYRTAVHAHLVRLDTGLDEAVLDEALRVAAPKPFQARKLAYELQANPSLLTGDGAHGSPRLIRLLEYLHARQARNIVMPPCPWCGRHVRLTTTYDGMRSCRACPARLRTKSCSLCGEVRRGGRGTDGSWLCRTCRSREPANHELCVRCGRTTEVRQTGSPAGVCFICTRFPTAVCSTCGKTTPCYRATTNSPQCPECCRQREECSACGKFRRVVTRTDSGEPVCGTCHIIVKACDRCGRHKRVSTRRTTGEALCHSCYRKDPARRQPCAQCGTITIPRRHGLGEACAVPARLRELLGDETGAVLPGLEPVFHALATGKPSSVMDWLNRTARASLLARIRDTGGPLTHQTLDDLIPADGVHLLRMILVAGQVLPARDEQLASLERWATTLLESIPDAHDRQLVHAFAHWHHLGRLRSRHSPDHPLSPNTAANVRYCLTQTVHFLQWLRHADTSLTACTQEDIDAYLCDGTVMRYKARGFVLWAARRSHIRHPVDFPPMPSDKPRRSLADDERWRLAHRFLHDDTIDTVDRVVGLLVLLNGQPLTKISRLTTSHVIQAGQRVQLALGTHPVDVPPPLDRLLLALAEDREGPPGLGRADQPWLLPGFFPGRPRGTAHLRSRLTAYGLPSRRGRNSAP